VGCIRLILENLIACHAYQERMKIKLDRLHVKVVVKDNTKFWPAMKHVRIAPWVSVKVIQGKLRAFHAVPVNSTMLPVLFDVKNVSIRPTLVEKEETPLAWIAQPVGRPKTAVLNVKLVVRVRLALGVNTVPWVLPEQELIVILPNANNVN